jgi:hypothetical protein
MRDTNINQMSDQPTKRPRRNLNALNNSSQEQPISNKYSNEGSNPTTSFKNQEYINIQPSQAEQLTKSNRTRNLDGLKDEYVNIQPSQPPKSNRARNLDGLEENIQFDIKKREERREKMESSGMNESRRRNRNVFVPPPEVKKVEQTTVNTLDEKLFPSLSAENKQVVQKEKVSIWNIINHNVTTVKPDLNNNQKVTNKGINKDINKDSNKDINKDVNITQIYSDNDEMDEMSEDIYYENESEVFDEEICDPDKDELNHLRDLYRQKYELENNIEFVSNTYNKSIQLHVKFLNQLERKLVTISDEIDRIESLENELEAIYGPTIRIDSHIKYKSLYDEMCDIKEKEENHKKFMKEFDEFVIKMMKDSSKGNK